MSLVQIAQEVSMAGAAVAPGCERSGPVAFSNVPDIIDMGSVHVILLEQQIEFIVRFRLVLCLSGLGNTRMLEEWERVFDLAQIPRTRLGALVLYYNGHKPQPIESNKMT